MVTDAERQDQATRKCRRRALRSIFQTRYSILKTALLIVLFGIVSACAQTHLQTDTKSEAKTAQGPALWRASDEDTTIIFFGTVHLLPTGIDWQREDLRTALAEASQLYLETSPQTMTLDEITNFEKASIAAPDAQLPDILSTEDYEKLTAVLEKLQMNPSIMDGRQPWFVSIILGRMVLENNGFRADLGAEAWLTTQAEAKNIPIRSLEKMTDVSSALSAFPQSLQIELLQSTLSEGTDLKDQYSNLISVWMAAETEKLHRLTMHEMQTKLPKVYDFMLEQRNRNWIPEIERIMREETGTVLIAVGSGHLIGPVSVIEMLREKDWKIEKY